MSQIIFAGISILLLLFASGLRADQTSQHSSSSANQIEYVVEVDHNGATVQDER